MYCIIIIIIILYIISSSSGTDVCFFSFPRKLKGGGPSEDREHCKDEMRRSVSKQAK